MSPVTTQIVFQILLISPALTCLISAAFVTSATIGELNRKLPKSDQISYLWGYHAKYRRINEEYRRLYPDGRLLLYNRALTFSGLGLILVWVLGWRFGIFR